MTDIGFLADALLNSTSLHAYAAYAVDPMLWVAPAGVLLRTSPQAQDRSVLRINGVSQQAILARLNAQKNAPAGKKLRHPPKALGKKGQLRKEHDRAEVKAVQRQHALEDSQTQRAYETAFRQQRRWNWKKVEKECKTAFLGFTTAGLAALAAAHGVIVDLPVFGV